MLLNLTISDLSNLSRIDRALKNNDPRSQFARLAMGEVQVKDNILEVLLEVVARYLRKAGLPTENANVCLMIDPVRIERAGIDFKVQVKTLLALKHCVTTVILDDGHDVLHAETDILDKAAQAVQEMDCLVSVGSGTLSDIAKVAAHRSDVPVHILLQTAASVDGFTDNFSVILQNGVKKTILSRWPEAVLADVLTIAEAPSHLTAAGMGEMMSTFCAPGDWYLADSIGVDDTFTPVLLELLSISSSGIEEWSKGVADRKIENVRALTNALNLRGIVTGCGGTTATLSGMEHLFSHMLDMFAGEQQIKLGLHGAQVGVGSIIRAVAWEVFCERMQETPINLNCLNISEAAHKQTISAAFLSLDPSGKIGIECEKRYNTKLKSLSGSWEKVEAFFKNWKKHKDAHDRLVLTAQQIANYLDRSNAPMRFDELDPPVSEKTARWVIKNCMFMRERFTIADLLYLAGWLDQDGVNRIMRRVDDVIIVARGAK